MTADPKLPSISSSYGSLAGFLRKFDRNARRSRFTGETAEEWVIWREKARNLLRDLLGLGKMEMCSLTPVRGEQEFLPDGIVREHWRIQVEPDVWTPFYLLIPEHSGPDTRPFLCPPGHGGAGKYSVAGMDRYSAVAEKIRPMLRMRPRRSRTTAARTPWWRT